jgi:hypothetical protein
MMRKAVCVNGGSKIRGGEGLDIHSFFSIEKMRIERNVDEIADNMEKRQPGVLT